MQAVSGASPGLNADACIERAKEKRSGTWRPYAVLLTEQSGEMQPVLHHVEGGACVTRVVGRLALLDL